MWALALWQLQSMPLPEGRVHYSPFSGSTGMPSLILWVHFFLYVIIRQAMPFCISAKWRLFYEWLWSLSGDVGSWGQFCHSSVSNIFQFNSPTKNQVRNWGHVYRIWLETHWDPGEEAAGNRKWRQNKGNMNYVAGPCSESQGTSIKTRHLLVKDRG